MGICISTVIATDGVNQTEPLQPVELPTAKEVVQKQPTRTKDFDADNNPLPTAGLCLCCLDPCCCNLCCGCDCWDCVLCDSCDCCLECDECCGQCLSNCF